MDDTAPVTEKPHFLNIDGLTFSHGWAVPDLFKALSSFQGKLAAKEIKRDKTVKVTPKSGWAGYSFKYSPLDTIKKVVDPLLAECGLSCTQPILHDGSIMTIVAHESGQLMMSKFKMTSSGTSAQDIGASMTYNRRYQYSAILGIVSEEDTDGNAGQNKFSTGEQNDLGDLIGLLATAKTLTEAEKIWDTKGGRKGKWTEDEKKQLDEVRAATKARLTTPESKTASIADKIKKAAPTGSILTPPKKEDDSTPVDEVADVEEEQA